MGNTLTGLLPVLYDAIDVVARELVGFVPAVSHNISAERAAVNQTVRVPVTPSVSAADNTPAVTVPNTGDQTVGYVDMLITKSRHVPIRWNGEEVVGQRTAGTYEQVLGQQFQQAFRTLVNEMEADLWAAAYGGASRAYGTAGTAPFGTAGDLSDLAQTRLILDNNGVPQSDLQLVLGGAAVANLRGKQSLLLKVNEAGSSALLRQGTISDLPLEGFALHNSSAIKALTKGTGASYVADGAVALKGTSIKVKTGTGTINIGDIVTSGSDANKYVANSAVAAAGDTFSIGSPGLLVAAVDGGTITVGNSYTPNLAFHRSAIQFIARQPALPDGGDIATDRTTIVDPISGLAFEVAEYKTYRQTTFQVAIAWGAKATKPDFISVLAG